MLPQLLLQISTKAYPVDSPRYSNLVSPAVILEMVILPSLPLTVKFLQASGLPPPPPFGVSSQALPIPSPSLSAWSGFALKSQLSWLSQIPSPSESPPWLSQGFPPPPPVTVTVTRL